MTTREFTCPHCSFMVRSENEEEVVEVVQRHATETHGTSMTEDDIRGAWMTG